MDTYRVEKTDTGWALFKAGKSRPVIEADTKEEVVRFAEQHLAGTKSSVRIHGASGTFQELRLEPDSFPSLILQAIEMPV